MRFPKFDRLADPAFRFRAHAQAEAMADALVLVEFDFDPGLFQAPHAPLNGRGVDDPIVLAHRDEGRREIAGNAGLPGVGDDGRGRPGEVAAAVTGDAAQCDIATIRAPAEPPQRE